MKQKGTIPARIELTAEGEALVEHVAVNALLYQEGRAGSESLYLSFLGLHGNFIFISVWAMLLTACFIYRRRRGYEAGGVSRPEQGDAECVERAEPFSLRDVAADQLARRAAPSQRDS